MKNRRNISAKKLKEIGQALTKGCLCYLQWFKKRKARPSEHTTHEQEENTPKTKEIRNEDGQEIREKKEMLYRKLLTNETISQLSNAQLRLLIEECQQHLDPEFFRWLRQKRIENLPARNIIFCILIRLHKNADEIKQILGMSHGAYRTYKSRLVRRLQGTEHPTITFEAFLQGLPVEDYEEDDKDIATSHFICTFPIN